LHYCDSIQYLINLPAAETAGYPEISPPLTVEDSLRRGGKYMVTPQQRLWGIENLKCIMMDETNSQYNGFKIK